MRIVTKRSSRKVKNKAFSDKILKMSLINRLLGTKLFGLKMVFFLDNKFGLKRIIIHHQRRIFVAKNIKTTLFTTKLSGPLKIILSLNCGL